MLVGDMGAMSDDLAEVTSAASTSGAYSLVIEELRRWLRVRMRGLATGAGGDGCG